MARMGLFEDLPEPEPAAERGLKSKPRLREPVRDQIELRAVDLESVIGSDHPARLIWAYVEKLDLSMLEDAIKAREGRPGHPPITPRLMMGLWLYATSQGIGSARVLERLCESEDAYRWMCGGVSVNYHTLSDFRTDHGDLLDRLLAENVAALASAGVIDLSSLTQDGIKLRAAAGAASFRRRKTLERHLEIARALVEELKREVDEDAAASSKRARAARERAARERLTRVQSALQQLGEVEALRKKRAKTNRKETEKQKEPRASTTDPEVRNLKMADGGFRPAYNGQVVSVAGEQIVVTVDPLTTGSDRGQIVAMLDQIPSRTGQMPKRYLADGGFTKAADIERAHGRNIAVYCPPIRSKHGGDPYAPHRKDGPGVLAWRARMASQHGQAVYKLRSLCECIHARWRHWNIRLTVRGRLKVKAAMLWHALANNILQGHRLMQAAAA